jgi:hypothetical protein
MEWWARGGRWIGDLELVSRCPVCFICRGFLEWGFNRS